MGRVYRSIIINAPAEKVWAKLRNFHDLSWATSVVEKLDVVGDLKADQVGAQRLLNDTFAETLLELNDRDCRFQYAIDDAPGTPVGKDSVTDYAGTVQVYSVTDSDSDQTFVEWHSTWNGNEGAGAEFCGGIYGALLGSLKSSFA